MDKHSKQMAHDDVLFSAVLIVISIYDFTNHPVAGTIMFIFGALWLGVRIYHLFFLKDDN